MSSAAANAGGIKEKLRSAFQPLYLIAFMFAIAQLLLALIRDAALTAGHLTQGSNATALAFTIEVTLIFVCVHLLRLYITLEKYE